MKQPWDSGSPPKPTAVSDFLIGTVAGAWIKKTLAEVKVILGLAADYAPIAKGVTNGDTHDHSGGDGAQIDHGGLAGLSDNDHPQYARWVYLNDPAWVGTANTPLTSTDWDGDSFSTTAKTLIDLSAKFGVPAGVKAISVKVIMRDSGSAAGNGIITLGPTNTAGVGKTASCNGLTNDAYFRGDLTVFCDANGDVYYQTVASGAGTLDITLEIHGYCLP